MRCEEIEGIWQKVRLAPDDSENALPGESTITLHRPDSGGRFTGEHGSGDPIVDGRCVGDSGPKLRIVFTRQHADGRTRTEYRGEIAYDEESDLSFIVKGRFTRTGDVNNVLAANGDWTTEKPT